MTGRLGAKLYLLRRDGWNLVYDGGTLATFIVDDLAYQVLQLYEMENGDCERVCRRLADSYTPEEVKGVWREIELLRTQGQMVTCETLPTALRADPADAALLRSSGMTLMMAQVCNLRCRYCYTDVGTFAKYPALMPLDIAKRAVDFLLERSKDLDVCKIGFFGGEPLLNLDVIKKTTDYCYQAGKPKGKRYIFSITTNGTLLDDEVLDFFDEQRVGIILSCDGPQEIHDSLRPFANGQGSWQIVMDSARRIRGRGRALYIRATLTHGNVCPERLVRYFEDEMGATKVLLGPMMDVSDPTTISLTRDDIEEVVASDDRLAAAALQQLRAGGHLVYHPWKEAVVRLHQRRGAIFACDAGKGKIAVATNGDIYPCHRFVGLESFVIGNVQEGLYPDAWAAFFNRFDDACEPCKSCWAYYQCAGGCARRRALPDGSFSAPNPMLCSAMQRSFERAIAIYAQLRKERPDLIERLMGEDTSYAHTNLPFA